jgi:hypothetical protein
MVDPAGYPPQGPPQGAPATYAAPGGYALPPRSGMGAGRIVAVVLGSLLALIGLAVTAGGGVLTWAHYSRSADGYLTTEAERFTTQTAALASNGLNIGVSGGDFLKGHLGSVRITATSTTGKPVFIGVGRESDVRTWLQGHAFDRASSIDFDPFSVT